MAGHTFAKSSQGPALLISRVTRDHAGTRSGRGVLLIHGPPPGTYELRVIEAGRDYPCFADRMGGCTNAYPRREGGAGGRGEAGAAVGGWGRGRKPASTGRSRCRHAPSGSRQGRAVQCREGIGNRLILKALNTVNCEGPGGDGLLQKVRIPRERSGAKVGESAGPDRPEPLVRAKPQASPGIKGEGRKTKLANAKLGILERAVPPSWLVCKLSKTWEHPAGASPAARDSGRAVGSATIERRGAVGPRIRPRHSGDAAIFPAHGV